MKKYLEEANKDSNLPTAAIVSGNGKTSGSNSLDRYNPFVPIQNPTPTVDIKRPEFDSRVVGTVGGGFSGGKNGSVTDEGLIIGNPGVEKMPTINNGKGYPTTPSTPSNPTLIKTPTSSLPKTETPTIPTPSTPSTTPSATPSTPTTPSQTTETTPTSNKFGATYQGSDFLEWYNEIKIRFLKKSA